MSDETPSPVRRLRIAMSRRHERDVQSIGDYLRAVGALRVDVTSAGKLCTLESVLARDVPDGLEDRVESWLHVFDPDGGSRLETASDDGPWCPGWEGCYRGVIIAPFHVTPPWADAAPDRLPVSIDPRGGFGSGNHETTRLTLTLLARAVGRLGGAARGADALDVGCGSGILSVALARLGLRPTAIDIEPAARAATRRTASANGIEVRVLDGGLEEAPGPFACVAANLNSQAVMDLAGALAARTAPGGALVLGGFHPPQIPSIESACGLGAGESLVSADGSWAGLLLRRLTPEA